MLIEEPEHGIVPPAGLLRYFVICFVILQAWLYMTNYVNRYGRWTWYEYGLAVVNMAAAVYLSNTISTEWERMAMPFNIAMLIMLLCVAALYAIQIALKRTDTGAAKNSLLILSIVCAVYIAALLAGLLGAQELLFPLDVAAVLCGAFLPFFIRGKFDASIISFPHLVERFELLTIVTFGEGVVGMAGYFDVTAFSTRPLLVFAILLTLFGAYVVQVHYLMDHHRTARSLRLMFSHYFIVIAINLVTVSLLLLENEETKRGFVCGLMLFALAMFYIALLSDSAYYKSHYRLRRQDALVFAGSFALGAVVAVAGREADAAFLLGVLIITAACFAWLLRKHQHR